MLTTESPFSIIRKPLIEFEEAWAGVLTSDIPLVADMSGHLALMKGKRFRPAMVYLSGLAVLESDATQRQRLRTCALVVEMIHTATLIHDDIIDHALLRRGVPAINARWNRKAAVLLGDYLFARSFVMLARETLPAVIDIMAEATYALSQGELLQEHHVWSTEIPESEYFRLIEMKTAALIGAACEIGSTVAGDPPEQRVAMREIGQKLGLIYQITDDILDIEGSVEDLGKPVHADFGQGRITLPLIRALQAATPAERERARDICDRARRRREPPDGQARTDDGTDATGASWEGLVDLVSRYNGVAQARQVVDELADGLRGLLDRHTHGSVRESFEGVIGLVRMRNH